MASGKQSLVRLDRTFWLFVAAVAGLLLLYVLGKFVH
jgi:hypothetical protein